MISHRRPMRRAFTLMEVILALSLVTFLLGMVAMAIDIHLRVADVGQKHVQQAQLARAILNLVAKDLRGAIRHEPQEIDATQFEDLALEMLDDPATMGVSTTSDGTSTSSTDDVGGLPETLPTVPGLYGESNWLQVDTAQLPRLDQYDAPLDAYDVIDDSGLADRTSDVKTIAYYVITDDDGDIYSGDSGDDSLGEFGLVRRELDRAATLYAEEQGLLDPELLEILPMAPEVAIIEFLYFDGTEWVEEWDSEERGGLPVAVRISVHIMPTNEQARMMRFADIGTSQEQQDLAAVYSLLVHIPMAEPTTLETTDEFGTADASDAGGGF